jgi:hypothetical protein
VFEQSPGWLSCDTPAHPPCSPWVSHLVFLQGKTKLVKKGQGEGGRAEMLSCIDCDGIYYGGFRCYAVDSK